MTRFERRLAGFRLSYRETRLNASQANRDVLQAFAAPLKTVSSYKTFSEMSPRLKNSSAGSVDCLTGRQKKSRTNFWLFPKCFHEGTGQSKSLRIEVTTTASWTQIKKSRIKHGIKNFHKKAHYQRLSLVKIMNISLINHLPIYESHLLSVKQFGCTSDGLSAYLLSQ